MLPPKSRGRGRASKPRVLIITGDDAVGKLMTSWLGEGCETVVIHDWRAVVRRLDRGDRFGCILCELRGATCSARHLAEAVDAIDPVQRGRIVFVTAGATGDDQSFVATSSNVSVSSPYDSSEVREAFRTVSP